LESAQRITGVLGDVQAFLTEHPQPPPPADLALAARCIEVERALLVGETSRAAELTLDADQPASTPVGGRLALDRLALEAGWQFRAACRVLELGTVRAYGWLGRRTVDQLADHRPGGSRLHGLLPDEVAEIVALFHQWGEIDRSHRKLAHRGSYLERVWVSPSSVRRVLAAEGLRLRPLPRPGRMVRKPFPDWVEYTPNSIWIFDTPTPTSPTRGWPPP
jgi:hypothetical protein